MNPSKFNTFETLAREYAYATEVNLTTLEGMRGLGGKVTVSVSTIRRQREICVGMIQVCFAHLSESEAPEICGRLKKVMVKVDRSALDPRAAVEAAVLSFEREA